MKYLIIISFSLSFLFSSAMEIDSTLIRDPGKAFRWSVLPVVSQGQMYNNKYLVSLVYFIGNFSG